MSANDKTGEKLVASMRKTKQAADSGGTPKGGAQKSQGGRPQKRAAGKAASRRGPATDGKPARDPYQSGRRVWPD